MTDNRIINQLKHNGLISPPFIKGEMDILKDAVMHPGPFVRSLYALSVGKKNSGNNTNIDEIDVGSEKDLEETNAHNSSINSFDRDRRVKCSRHERKMTHPFRSLSSQESCNESYHIINKHDYVSGPSFVLFKRMEWQYPNWLMNPFRKLTSFDYQDTLDDAYRAIFEAQIAPLPNNMKMKKALKLKVIRKPDEDRWSRETRSQSSKKKSKDKELSDGSDDLFIDVKGSRVPKKTTTLSELSRYYHSYLEPAGSDSDTSTSHTVSARTRKQMSPSTIQSSFIYQPALVTTHEDSLLRKIGSEPSSSSSLYPTSQMNMLFGSSNKSFESYNWSVPPSPTFSRQDGTSETESSDISESGAKRFSQSRRLKSKRGGKRVPYLAMSLTSTVPESKESHITDTELSFCSKIRLDPRVYLNAKETMITLSKNKGLFKKTAAQKLFRMDVNKTGKIYDFIVSRGWMERPL